MVDLSPLLGEDRKSDLGDVRAAVDPSAAFICPNVGSRMR